MHDHTADVGFASTLEGLFDGAGRALLVVVCEHRGAADAIGAGTGRNVARPGSPILVEG